MDQSNAAPAQPSPAQHANQGPQQPDGAMTVHGAAAALDGLNLFDDDAPTGGNDNQPDGDDAPGSHQPAHSDQGGNPQDDDDALNRSGDDQDDDTDDGTPNQDATPDDDAAPDTDGQPSDITSLAELSEALQVDQSQLMGLQVTFKAAGENVTVDMNELVSGYQKDADYRRNSSETAELRRTVEAEQAQTRQAYTEQLTRLGATLQHAERLLMGEINTDQMAELRTSNPAEWTARREEVAQRLGAIRQMFQGVNEQFNQVQQQQVKEHIDRLTTLRQTEMAKVMERYPNWDSELKGQLKSYLADAYQYTPQDLQQVFDARLIDIANKARLYDQMQTVGAETRKKVTPLPKPVKPGKSSAPPAQRSKLRKAKAQAAKTNTLRDAASAIGHLNLE